MNTYNFYGVTAAGKVNAKSRIYKGIETAIDLYDALSDIWCEYTCAPRLRNEWSTENKTKGQCSITAFLAQDIFGGEVYGMPTPSGGVHCYNVVDGYIFDLTSEQFGKEAASLVYEDNELQDRNSAMHFMKEEKRLRYEYIKEKMEQKCNI